VTPGCGEHARGPDGQRPPGQSEGTDMKQALTHAFDAGEQAAPQYSMRVVGYFRVSTEEQKQGFGIASQERRVMAWCGRKEYVHVGNYADEGVSGSVSIEHRPVGRQLMDDARAKRFDLVMVKAGDRIGRTKKAFWSWVWALEELGVHVALVNADLDNTTSQGREEMCRQQAYAEKEWETTRERTQDGLQEKVQAGGFPGGVHPYGYRIEGKGQRGASRLVLDVCPDSVMCSAVHEADVLRRAWESVVIRGRNLRQTAKFLNEAGLYARNGKLWTATNLRNRLNSRALQERTYVYRNPDTAGLKTGTRLGPDGQPLYGPTTAIQLPPVFDNSLHGLLQSGRGRSLVSVLGEERKPPGCRGVQVLPSRRGCCGGGGVARGTEANGQP
jgi:DNA invertase Pin-like site-specific DNA recombinase